MAPLSAENLTGMRRKEIEKTLLQYGNEKVALADIFRITGENVEYIVFEDSTVQMESIGYGMQRGVIRIYGDAGAFTAENMCGGELSVVWFSGRFCR